MNKLKRVRNMLNRLMEKKRFHQWVNSVQYILSIADAGNLSEKVILKRRLRNNFMKLMQKTKMSTRAERIQARVDWFNKKRAHNTSNDCY